MKFPQLFIVVQRRPISYGSNFQPLLDVFTKCTYFFQSKAIVAFTMTFQQSGIPVLNVCIQVAEIQVVIFVIFSKKEEACRTIYVSCV